MSGASFPIGVLYPLALSESLSLAVLWDALLTRTGLLSCLLKTIGVEDILSQVSCRDGHMATTGPSPGRRNAPRGFV